MFLEELGLEFAAGGLTSHIIILELVEMVGFIEQTLELHPNTGTCLCEGGLSSRRGLQTEKVSETEDLEGSVLVEDPGEVVDIPDHGGY